jgi:hypothetical protein
MIYDEQNKSCIVYEEERLKDGCTQRLVSFYDNHPCCDGDVVIEDEIYEVENPCWLSDTFVFCKKHYNDVFLVGEVDSVFYIKVNHHNQVEEIGTDFESRFSCDYYSLLERKDVKKATNLHKIMFTLIGSEYWLKLFVERKENAKVNV